MSEAKCRASDWCASQLVAAPRPRARRSSPAGTPPPRAAPLQRLERSLGRLDLQRRTWVVIRDRFCCWTMRSRSSSSRPSSPAPPSSAAPNRSGGRERLRPVDRGYRNRYGGRSPLVARRARRRGTARPPGPDEQAGSISGANSDSCAGAGDVHAVADLEQAVLDAVPVVEQVPLAGMQNTGVTLADDDPPSRTSAGPSRANLSRAGLCAKRPRRAPSRHPIDGGSRPARWRPASGAHAPCPVEAAEDAASAAAWRPRDGSSSAPLTGRRGRRS